LSVVYEFCLFLLKTSLKAFVISIFRVMFLFCRGQANEWYEAVSVLVRQSLSLRRWFVIEELLAQPERIMEYLLECPVGEVLFWSKLKSLRRNFK